MESRPRSQVQILDRAGLAELVRERVADTLQLEAAKEARVSQAVLNKILNQKKDRLATATLRRLIAYLGPKKHQSLRKVILTARSATALDAYRSWLMDELRVINQHREAWGVYEPFTDEATVSRWMKGEVFTTEGDRANESVHDLFWELTDWPICGQLLDGFLRWAERRGYAPGGFWGPRLKLAILRIIRPLTAASVSGGIERELMEMTSAEIAAYLKVAIRKEQILMRRSADLERAQQIT